MIIISNSERDQIVRFIDILCQVLKGDDTRTYNTKRLARNLQKRLRNKQPVSANELIAANNRKQQ